MKNSSKILSDLYKDLPSDFKSRQLGKDKEFRSICLDHDTYALQISLYKNDANALFIDGIETKAEHRGKGVATFILNTILELADTYNVFVYLYPNPYEDNMTIDQLIAIYNKFGFFEFGIVEDGGYPNNMVYQPGLLP